MTLRRSRPKLDRSRENKFIIDCSTASNIMMGRVISGGVGPVQQVGEISLVIRLQGLREESFGV